MSPAAERKTNTVILDFRIDKLKLLVYNHIIGFINLQQINI